MFNKYIHQILPLLNLLSRDDMPSAKDTLFKLDVYNDIMSVLNRLSSSTLEGILIHVLSELLHEGAYSTVLRAATLSYPPTRHDHTHLTLYVSLVLFLSPVRRSSTWC